jgi:hypothetical protein
VIRLRIGNIVPADVQLIEGDYLLIDQSALTGESLPVSKKQEEVAYASTVVKQGEMLAVVVNTGANTNFHTVVELVAKASLQERSHFQKMVIRIGDFLIAMTVVLVLLIVMVSLFRHENMLEIARFALVLSVAAIPVALPAVLSVTMAVGAMNLARRQAIVSRLTAIEELAGADVFCSDKTGTLTQNQMQVAEPVPLGGASEGDLLLTAALASKTGGPPHISSPSTVSGKSTRNGASSPDRDREPSLPPAVILRFPPVRDRVQSSSPLYHPVPGFRVRAGSRTRFVDRLPEHPQKIPAPELPYLLLRHAPLHHGAGEQHELRHIGHHRGIREAVVIGTEADRVDTDQIRHIQDMIHDTVYSGFLRIVVDVSGEHDDTHDAASSGERLDLVIRQAPVLVTERKDRRVAHNRRQLGLFDNIEEGLIVRVGQIGDDAHLVFHFHHFHPEGSEPDEVLPLGLSIRQCARAGDTPCALQESWIASPFAVGDMDISQSESIQEFEDIDIPVQPPGGAFDFQQHSDLAGFPGTDRILRGQTRHEYVGMRVHLLQEELGGRPEIGGRGILDEEESDVLLPPLRHPWDIGMIGYVAFQPARRVLLAGEPSHRAVLVRIDDEAFPVQLPCLFQTDSGSDDSLFRKNRRRSGCDDRGDAGSGRILQEFTSSSHVPSRY